MAASVYGETPLGLSSQILNLGGVFTRKPTMKVPRYQRPYTWTEREVRRLIQDLRRAFERGATFYFIGQIVFVKNDRGELEISDGQQRLATLTMIIAYVRDRIPHRAAHYQGLIMLNEGGGRPRILLREDDASFFRGYVQEQNQLIAMTKLDDIGVDSKDLLCAAARTISVELKEMPDRDLDAFISFVARCATFNVMDAHERGAAATVYNTVNDRGLALSAADNIKCDLLENSRLKREEADAAARKWEELEDILGRANFAKLLNLMPFLLTGEQLVSPGDLGAFREQVEKSGGVRTFLFEQLPRYAYALRDIFNEAIDVGPASTDVNRRVRMMAQLDEWNWAPAALAFLAEHRGQPERARKFFQALERFSFACELSVIENKLREKRFAKAARAAGDDKQLYGPGGALELTETERYKFIERLNRSSKRDRQRRLLMIRLEAAMPGGSLLSLTHDCTVEHVLPKNGSPWWNERFPDRLLREDAAQLLGNLILVTDRQNDDCENKPYPHKREIYFRRGVTLHAVTRDIEGVEEWTLDAINARHERLVRILCADWDLVRGA